MAQGGQLRAKFRYKTTHSPPRLSASPLRPSGLSVALRLAASRSLKPDRLRSEAERFNDWLAGGKIRSAGSPEPPALAARAGRSSLAGTAIFKPQAVFFPKPQVFKPNCAHTLIAG